MTPLYSFKITNDSFNQVAPFALQECNDILNGVFYFSHSTFLTDISTVFVKYQFLNIDFMPKIAICIGDISISKHNPTDKESTLDSIISFLKLLDMPSCGVHITFFKTTNYIKNQDIGSPDGTFQALWSFKDEWIGDGDYILLGKVRGKEWLDRVNLDFVHEFASENGYEVKEIGYGQSVREQHKLLKHCKMLVSQRGAITYFSAMMRTPTIFVAPPNSVDNVILPMTDDFIGCTIFDTNVVGINKVFQNYHGKLIQTKFDKHILTYPDCDNKTIMSDVLNNPNNMMDNFIKAVKNNNKEYVNTGLSIIEQIKDYEKKSVE